MKTLRIASAVIAAGALSLLATAASAASAADSFTMKMGFATINDSNHKVALWMQKELAKTTKGRIKVSVYPAGQLGRIPRQIEGIQLGTQEVFLIPPGFFVGINPAFQVPDAPGMFDDISHQHRAMNHPPFRKKFMNLAEHAGILGSVIWSCGDTSIATLKPFKTLDDMKGRKIRVLASKLEAAVINALGGAGVPMPYTEVLPAMQRRVIDGVRTGVIVMGPSKFYTVAKHLTLTGQGHIPCGMWLSKMWANKLPADLKQAVADASKKVTPLVGKWGEEMTRAWEKKWTEVGGTIHHLSAADKKEFRRRVLPLGDKMLGSNPKTKDMYEMLKTAVAATRQK